LQPGAKTSIEENKEEISIIIPYQLQKKPLSIA
jgi:hypothetical protein